MFSLKDKMVIDFEEIKIEKPIELKGGTEKNAT